MKVANDQAEITAAIGRVSAVADELVLAVDILGTPSALLAPLGGARQSVYYASRRVVATRVRAYTGKGETDTKDYVIG